MLGLMPTPWEFDRFVLMHASISRLESMKVGDVHSFSLVKLSDVEHLSSSERTADEARVLDEEPAVIS